MSRASPASLFAPPFQVDEPERQTLPFVYNTGHSGAVYPASFVAASRLDAVALRRSEDAFVDRSTRPSWASAHR